jgi:hypothetical protein
MIRLREATVIAGTKFRTRQARTIITIVISGLLFGCLVAALAVFQGASDSVKQFSAEGLGNRYIVKAVTDPVVNNNTLNNKSIQRRAQQIYKQMVAEKAAAAKKLGVSYNSSQDRKPVVKPPEENGAAFLDITTPAAEQAMEEYLASHPLPNMNDLRHLASGYHPAHFYMSSALVTKNGAMETMFNGKEGFSANPSAAERRKDVLSSPLELMSPELIKPFLLPDAKNAPDSRSIPIVVPYSAAERLLGFQKLPASASSRQQLARIKELYKQARAITFTACYRNEASKQQIQQALNQKAVLAEHKNDKTYQKPDLIYGLPPAASCAAAPVKRDARSAAEKAQAVSQKKFSKKFGAIVQPEQEKLSFRIAGLVPDQDRGAPSNTAAGILQNLAGSSLSGIIAVPRAMYEKLPKAARHRQIFSHSQSVLFRSFAHTYYVEFANAADARQFINDKSCTTRVTGTCATAAKPFQLTAFGSNSIALQDLQDKFSKFFKLLALAVIIIAIIIMSGTIGRTIADGRHETAVFRATGAKRADTAVIYTIYTALLSVCVAIFAIGSGLAAAYGIDRYFWQAATVQAKLAFGGADSSLQFHFFAVPPIIFLVAAVAIICGFISMVFPLIRNVRRNPVNDMRDE